MAIEYTQISIRTLCHSCLGCQQLENPKFPGVVKCNNYIFGNHEFTKSLNKDYGSIIDSEKERQKAEERFEKDEWKKVIDKYWTGD
jgi:hypothetical protein